MYLYTLLIFDLITKGLLVNPQPADPKILTAKSAKSTFAHHSVSTHNNLAQDAFDEGLTWRYAFNNGAAAKAFERAIKLDPNLAMAYWGLALSYGADINTPTTPEREKRAFDAIQNARRLIDYASPAERDYINALSVRYSSDPAIDRKILAKHYAEEMQKLFAKYPNDPDVGTLFAESMLDLMEAYGPENWPTSFRGNPQMDPDKEIESTLDKVLKIDGNHLGANHLYIHAYDHVSHPEKAVKSADFLAKQNLAPEAAHLAHMPSHVYLRVGRFYDAVVANKKALALDDQFDKKYLGTADESLQMEASMYRMHNLTYLIYASIMGGDFESGFARLKNDNETLLPWWLNLRFKKWDELLALPMISTSKDHLEDNARKRDVHFARAIAFSAKGEKDNFEKEATHFQSCIENNSSNSTEFNVANPIELNGKIELLLIQASRAQLDRNFNLELKYLRDAVNVQDYQDLFKHEIPNFLIPTREFLAEALIKQNIFQEARNVLDEDLRMHPNSAKALELVSKLPVSDHLSLIFSIKNSENNCG